ncbi:DUF7507 domain-containing protein, partial [Pontibaca methylaminivorans]|uniref:DUF7507 domain-containing protein n=1 Tax=Pontibaca methylaminivorans TaxID=515897 RepID=UPI003FA76263
MELPRTGAQLVLRNNAEVVATGELSGKQPTDASNDGGTPQRGVSSPSQRQLAFNPAMALAKTATLDNGGGAARAGDIIRFGFTVTNTGDTPLVDISLADPLPGLVWDANPVLARLDPDQSDSTSFAAHYVLTQEDVEAGGLDNTATATGRWAVDGVPDPVTTAQGSAGITALAEPGLEVVKTEVANTVQVPTRPGDTIRYEFTVSNTGNTLLHDVVLTDDLPGIAADPAGSFVIGTLSPAGEAGSLVTFHADYTVTQDDIDAGEVINTARAAGTHGPGGPPIGADAPPVTTPLVSDPLMRVTKLVDTATVPATPRAGDSIGWTVTIENTGNTSLNIGTIAESLPDASIMAPGSALLAPGESTTAAVSHTLTQADIDAGEVANQVTVSGRVPGSDTPFRDTPSGNDPDTPNEDPTVVTLDPAPGIALLKSLVTDVSGPLMPGDAITFSFAIRNTGNVTLHDLVLSDDLPDVVLDDAALSGLSLAPDDEVTVTGSYVLTPADIEAGGFDNSAIITASDPGGTSVTDLSGTGFDNDGPTRVDLLREPDIALIKTISAAPAVPAAAGDRIDYGFEIRNTGNVELRDIALA